MAPSFTSVIVASFVVFQGLTHNVSAKQQSLCADKNGIFLGLAIDEDSYDSISGLEGEPQRQWHRPEAEVGPIDTEPTPAQKWTITEEGLTGPKNSIGGKYLQVLPDSSHRTYPSGHSTHGDHDSNDSNHGMHGDHNSNGSDHGNHGNHGNHGHHLRSISEIETESPYLSFQLRVKKDREGWHTLFVRWTGGDTVGGGDSFYVVLKHKGKIVPGERTIKPAVLPIDSKLITYAGCCYQRETHACPCYRQKPDEQTCQEGYFLDVERAAGWGKECPVGQGMMELVKAPEWYLFSGQEDGNVMDFADEPWDATCEANGSNTQDSGHDFPSWHLEKGDYELRVYAREDGTALDGIYIAGPDSVAPGLTNKYSAGDSTLCPRVSGGLFKTIGVFLVVGLGLASLLALTTMTEAGQELAHQGKLMINKVFHKNSAQQEGERGYEQMGQSEVGTFQIS